MSLKQKIRNKAESLGFDVVGFTGPETNAQDIKALAAFLKNDYHASMAWMAANTDRRGHATALMEDVKSIIVLGCNYGPAIGPKSFKDHGDRGRVSVYARGRDYHDVMKKRMKQIGRWLADDYGSNIRVFVDTAPVMEKPLAARAGLGWQGKHTNLVSREFGSWLFLSEIFTSLDISPDRPEADHCGSCNQCIKACPTDAFPKPYQVDARRCISYLTIEHKDMIDAHLMENMGNHIYGCDDCLDACPWNKYSKPTTEPAFFPRVELTGPRLSELVQLDDTQFRDLFAGSPIKRTGRERFVRNVLIAIANSGDVSLRTSIETKLSDVSSLVRDTAKWALHRLDTLVAKDNDG